MPPQYSPAQGFGTIYTDPQTGTSYQFVKPGKWVQISQGALTQGVQTGGTITNAQDLSNYVKNLLGGADVQTLTTPPIPKAISLDYTPPTGEQISAKWDEFLQRASSDSKLIDYYKTLYDMAKGRYEDAVDYLKKDYEMGFRQTEENLAGTIESLLGVKFPTEEEALQESLNKRGIALTQEAGQQPVYAGGGEAKKEVERLREDQRLRKEAEERTARQKIEELQLKREKGLTSEKQSYEDTGMYLKKAKEEDVKTEAERLFNVWQTGETGKYQSAVLKQQQQQYGGGDSSGQASQPTDWGTIFKTKYPGWPELEAKYDWRAKTGQSFL